MNLAVTMEEAASTPFALRGYPPQLNVKQALPPFTTVPCIVAASVGLQIGSGDLSAATRLSANLKITGLKPGLPKNFTLPGNVWAPFSIHNLALRRDCVPAFFLSPYSGRFDDIWAGFILTRIADHQGQQISFGAPLLEVPPPTTNADRDVDQERVGYRQSRRLSNALRSIRLSGTSFHECFGQIAAALPLAWPELPAMSGIKIEAHKQLLVGLRYWHQLFAAAAARSTGNLFESIANTSQHQPVGEAVGSST